MLKHLSRLFAPDKSVESLKCNMRKLEDVRETLGKSEMERKDEKSEVQPLFAAGEEWEEAEERR